MGYILDPTDTRAQLGSAYHQFNARYFGGRLPAAAVIRFEAPSEPGSLGDCDWWGPAPVIRIAPTLLTGAHGNVRGGSLNPVGLFRLVADVLLHESVHVYLAYVLGDRGMDQGGHHERFARECRRIDDLLGNRRRRVERVPITVSNCDFFPENRRKPDGYYLGCLRHSWTLATAGVAPVRYGRGVSRDEVLARARLVELGLG